MKAIRIVFFMAVIALIPAMGWAAAAPLPGSGIALTSHDFTAGDFLQLSTIGECTFCHTPHKGISTLLLWNHTLSANTFSWDAANTTAGTPFAKINGLTYNGPTAKCLSCHDGSVAVGDVNWFMETKGIVPGGELKITDPGHLVGAGGSMSGNHPVAMPYPYQQVANTYNGITTSSAATPGYGFVANEWQPTPVLPIRVYNDDGSGNITGGPVAGKTGIECSSCHDPHNKAAVDDMFLRGKLTGNTNDYLCLKCHIK